MRLSIVLALVFLTAGCSTQRQAELDSDEDKKAWREIEAALPPYPKATDLIAVDAGGAVRHQFFVDASSVSLGEDGVMRYATVVKTEGGATNVTFEGMRCETREQKLYALGHSDKTWARARDSKWQRIEFRDSAPHRFTLYRDYFCPARTRPTAPRQALDALRRGQSLSRAQTGYD
jgi:hypothetical protein